MGLSASKTQNTIALADKFMYFFLFFFFFFVIYLFFVFLYKQSVEVSPLKKKLHEKTCEPNSSIESGYP